MRTTGHPDILRLAKSTAFDERTLSDYCVTRRPTRHGTRLKATTSPSPSGRRSRAWYERVPRLRLVGHAARRRRIGTLVVGGWALSAPPRVTNLPGLGRSWSGFRHFGQPSFGPLCRPHGLPSYSQEKSGRVVGKHDYYNPESQNGE